MIVYHGSSVLFKELKIGEEYSNGHGSKNNEGLGIYFSDDMSVAAEYGKYIYEIEIPDLYERPRTWDLCNFDEIEELLECAIATPDDIYIGNFINVTKLIDEVSKAIYNKRVSIDKLPDYICTILDNTESFFDYCNKTNEDSELVIETIRLALVKFFKENCSIYVFPSEIGGYNTKIGVIKETGLANAKIKHCINVSIVY